MFSFCLSVLILLTKIFCHKCSDNFLHCKQIKKIKSKLKSLNTQYCTGCAVKISHICYLQDAAESAKSGIAVLFSGTPGADPDLPGWPGNILVSLDELEDVAGLLSSDCCKQIVMSCRKWMELFTAIFPYVLTYTMNCGNKNPMEGNHCPDRVNFGFWSWRNSPYVSVVCIIMYIFK